MGLLNVFKKKKGPEIYWKQMDLIADTALVEYYIKRILRDNVKDKGIIYLNDDYYMFSYGNLNDIVPAEVMSKAVKDLYGACDDTDGTLYFKIIH